MNLTNFNQFAVLLCAFAVSNGVCAFDSGSTGADGAFNPTASQTIPLPASGIFNYTTVNIPAGVTISYTANAANTPVTILAQGDVVINGTIDVSGAHGDSTENDSGQNFFTYTQAGPGGYPGGRGGLPSIGGASQSPGGSGLGPGGGIGARCGSNTFGGGGSYATVGGYEGCNSRRSSTYGSVALLPLIGGSGGGGGAHNSVPSASGGGGGGAILIASSGTMTINGTIRARGGNGGIMSSNFGDGGGGSGGAIRLIATTLAGNGAIDARGGTGGYNNNNSVNPGGDGRIRLEAETLTFTSPTTPIATYSMPRAVTLPGLPGLRITAVNGITVPAIPNGYNDVVLPASITNPVTINLTATGVPVGEVATLTVTPVLGLISTATSSPLAGTTASSTATVSIDLPQGPSTLLATVSFAVTATQATAFLDITDGEEVAKVEIASGLNGTGYTRLVTVSGKYFDLPPSRQIALQ